MFKRAIVLDIISHPGLLNEQIINKFVDEKSVFKLSNLKNKEFLKMLPANSIIGSFVHNKSIFVALPFFSSHMSLPIKLQEEVWIYEDTTASKDFESEYYWLSRIHGTNFYEDVNYTHADRKYLRNYTFEKSFKDKSTNLQSAPVALFNNGPVRVNSNASSGDLLLENRDKKIKSNLNLSTKHLFEDVPRAIKSPGDYIIQGSNNTLIRLGTNHIRKSYDNYLETYNNSIFFNEPTPYSGTIDLVAGRASLSQSFAVEKKSVDYIKDQRSIFSKNISTKAYKNSQLVMYNEFEKTENLKDSEFYLGTRNINLSEGDPDFLTDTSRILISEYLNGDELLNYSNISNLNTISRDGKQKNVLNDKTRGYIIAKSDEIRLVARGDVITKGRDVINQLEYSNQFEEAGSIRLIKEGDFSNAGYIIIDSTGNVSIDGPAIVLGDKIREKENGKGDSIYLGNDANEPGVLGYMLKNKLENFMDETIRALNIIGLCLKDLSTHNHSFTGVAPGSPGSTTLIAPPMSNFINNTNFGLIQGADSNATERAGSPDDINGNYGKIGTINASSVALQDKINGIAEIRESLSDILSKMVKTL